MNAETLIRWAARIGLVLFISGLILLITSFGFGLQAEQGIPFARIAPFAGLSGLGLVINMASRFLSDSLHHKQRQAEAPPAPGPRPRERAAREESHVQPEMFQAGAAAFQAEADEGLHIRDITKSMGKRAVLKGVSLSLHRGEVVGLLGPNGAGKTTCFYIVIGLLSPGGGAIYLDGHDFTRMPMYQRARMGISYLAQEASIFRGMTVEQNVMSVVETHEPDHRRARLIVDELLEEMQVSHLRRSPAVTLSGGERRRVEIARALASGPSFLLLDEPFAGLDPIAVADLREVIFQLKARNLGVLITDHNVRETLDIVDRASIISDGAVLFEGPPAEILANAGVRSAYLGDNYS